MVSFRSHLGPQRVRRWPSVVAGIICFLNTVNCRAADTNAVLANWFTAQAGVHSLSADFVQTRTLKTLVQPLKSSGHLWFVPPDKFHWELGHPAQTIAIRDADQMYIVYPHLKRAERYPLGAGAPEQWRDAMALLDAGFPRTRQEFDKQFELQSLTENNGQWQLALQPRSEAARQMMPQMLVMLSANNLVLAGTELEFKDGSRMRNDFTNVALNEAIADTMFQWTPPADYTVTEPLAK